MKTVTIQITRNITVNGRDYPTRLTPVAPGEPATHDSQPGWETDNATIQVPDDWRIDETWGGEVALFDGRDRCLRLSLARNGNIIAYRHIDGDQFETAPAMAMPILSREPAPASA